MISINVALTSSVAYPEGTLDKTLRFQTSRLFSEKRRYYVLLDPGWT